MIDFNKFVFAQQQQTATVDKDTLMASIAQEFYLITEQGVKVPVNEQLFEQWLKHYGGEEETEKEEGAE